MNLEEFSVMNVEKFNKVTTNYESYTNACHNNKKWNEVAKSRPGWLPLALAPLCTVIFNRLQITDRNQATIGRPLPSSSRNPVSTPRYQACCLRQQHKDSHVNAIDF